MGTIGAILTLVVVKPLTQHSCTCDDVANTSNVNDAENGATSSPDRDPTGRFRTGHRGGPGRRPGQSLTAELRRQCDVESLAARIIELAHQTKKPELALKACQEIADRLEGKAIARSVRVNAASQVLPVGFFDMPPEARGRILDDVRMRAVAGELAPGADNPDTGNEEHE